MKMRLDLGYIEHDDGSEAHDEALIFVNDDNDQTIHVQCPNAKEIARALIRALETVRVLANTPPEEWRSKIEIHAELAEFRSADRDRP